MPMLPANGDERDSDGTGTSMAVIALTTGRAGENNHSYDFGFKMNNSCAEHHLPIQTIKPWDGNLALLLVEQMI